MKKLLTILLLPLSTLAQPIVQNAEHYTIGTTIKYITCGPIGAGPAGINQVWNFTGLSSIGDTQTNWITAPPTNNAFPTADFVINDEDNTHTYVNSTTTESVNLGMLDSTTGDTVDYVTGQLRMKRPFTYLDTAVDSYSYVSAFGTMPLYAEGNQHFKADGYGTLYLPNDTFLNVTRVRIVFYERDSIETLGNIDINGIMHVWYSDTGAAPLLRVDSLHISSTIIGFPTIDTMDVRYLYTEQPTAIANPSQQVPVLVTGHLASNTLSLTGNFEQGKQYDIAMFGMNGQKVYGNSFTGSNTTQHFNTGDLSNGVYIITVRKKGDIASTNVIKVVKQ